MWHVEAKYSETWILSLILLTTTHTSNITSEDEASRTPNFSP